MDILQKADFDAAAAGGHGTTRFRPLRDGLGRLGAISIFGGSLLLLGVLAFLLFLWLGEGPGDGEHAPRLWRWIVLGQFTTQAITLSSVVLRVVTATQAAVCTSLVAAVVLENHGIRLSRAAEVSAMRSVNDGPLKLAWLLVRHARKCVAPATTACLLLAASVAVQFSSTLLISDLATSAVVGDAINETRPVFMNAGVLSQVININYWLQKPSAYEPFGEIPRGRTPPLMDRGVSDTGAVKRVFLPIPQDERPTLRRYQGKAFVFHSRHVCMRPVMDAAVFALREPIVGNPTEIEVVGNMSYAASLQAAGLGLPANCAGGLCFSAGFNCSLPTFQKASDKSFYGDFVAGVCLLDGMGALNSANKTELSGDPVTTDSQVFLVTRNNGSYDESWTVQANGSAVGINETFNLAPAADGEWATAQLPNGVRFDFSLCFQQVAVDLSDVAVSRGRDVADPRLAWNATANAWDTTAVRQLLGLLGNAADAAGRGIFTWSRRPTRPRTSTRSNTTACSWPTRGSYRRSRTSTPAPSSPLRPSASPVQPPVEYQALFTDTLRSTDRPALALQAAHTAMTSSIVDGFIAQYDVPGDVEAVSSVLVLVPRAAAASWPSTPSWSCI